MIATLTEFVEKNWARPYEVLTSIVGLLVIFGGLAKPLHTASRLLSSLDAHTWSAALSSANTWMNTHQLSGESVAALAGVLLATTCAGLSALPTRSAGTYWIFAALAIYGGSSLGDLIFSTVLGLIAGIIVDVVRKITLAEGGQNVVFRLFDVFMGAAWVPIVIFIWILKPRRKEGIPG